MHRKGFGKRLFEFAEAHIVATGHETIVLGALGSHPLAFYASMGMIITGKKPWKMLTGSARQMTVMGKVSETKSEPKEDIIEKIKLRFFFDGGSDTCLWSGNSAARERFDSYPVELHQPPLSVDLRARVTDIMARYDTAIDWDYPANPSPWTQEERVNFMIAVESVLSCVITELGPEFEVVDEMIRGGDVS